MSYVDGINRINKELLSLGCIHIKNTERLSLQDFKKEISSILEVSIDIGVDFSVDVDDVYKMTYVPKTQHYGIFLLSNTIKKELPLLTLELVDDGNDMMLKLSSITLVYKRP